MHGGSTIEITSICCSSPILGLVLLLSVCLPYSFFVSLKKSDNVFLFFKQANFANHCDKMVATRYQAKCIDGSNSFPEGDRGVLIADLNRWWVGKVLNRKQIRTDGG